MVKVRRKLVAARAEIEEAIGKAEKGTSAELVVVVCKRAGLYGRQESIFAFMASLITLTIAWLILQKVENQPWGASPAVSFGLGWVLLTLVLSFCFAQVLTWRFPKIASAFVSKAKLRAKAEQAAAFSFNHYRVSKTEQSTGVLIFIAEVEQTVVVLGDNQVANVITKNQWEDIRDAILDGVKSEHPVEGLCNGIRLAGDLLRANLPAGSEEYNERPNRIYFR